MKHRTLRCAAETLVLLLIAAMAVFLAAGLHQRAPDGALSTLSTGWYQLTDGVRREVTLPAALETGPGQTITLYNDTLTDSDGGKVLSARGVECGIEIRAGETLLYRYEDNAFPKNAQMKGRLWADTELPYGLGGQTLSLTFTELPGRMCRIDAPVLGSMPAVTGRHIQSSLFSAGMILVMLVLAVLALLIFLYMSFYGIRERRFLDTAVFLLLCSLWCLTDSGLYQLYGADTAAGSVVSFYAFMTMAIPMVHFVRNTVSGRLRLVPDVLIALLCINALAQGAAYRLFGVPFIDMLPLTHLLLTAGVAAMLTVLFRSYRAQPAPQLRLRMAAFAALGAFGVAALVLYWLLHIYWYDAVYQFGVLLFIILLLHGLISQAAEDMRFHMEHRISHEMQREDRMTGLPNRRAFEEYMERVRTGEAGCLDAVLTYIRLEGLNERNDRFGLQAGDEAVIAAARCVSDFCRECEDEGESVLCFRTGGNEFALIRPEPHIDSGQLHRQFRAVVARYNRTCAPRARITMTFGFSRLCDEDGKSRSISVCPPDGRRLSDAAMLTLLFIDYSKPIYQSARRSPKNIAAAMPMHRNGPKAKRVFRSAFFAASSSAPKPPPSRMPRKAATTVSLAPRKKPAPNISLMSPPPKPPGTTSARSSMGRLTITQPSSRDFIPGPGKTNCAAAPQTSSSAGKRS